MLDYAHKPFRLYEYRAKRELTMPRIADYILNCVIYLYPDRLSAERSHNAGGSGFIVGVQSKTSPETYHTYAVTNAHVVGQGACTIRLNTRGGGFDVIEKNNHDWVRHPDGDDLVVTSIGLDQQKHQIDFFITDGMFATLEKIKEVDIGIGDDVFIVGRFQVADGKLQNTPTLRFGNIAQMPIEPIEPIENPFGIKQESYLVECHSISGFSGSPVFVRIDGMSARPNSDSINTMTYQFLLGVDWGHLLIDEAVVKQDQATHKWAEDKTLCVSANSAMMGVVPVWKLQQLLDDKGFADMREKKDKDLKDMQEVAQQSSKPTIKQDNLSLSKDEFDAALKQVSRKINPSQSDQPKPKT